ncbi:hypothetical protein C2R22_20320 [Salinigranum rubrum]|uniref:Uncharacterized protein n=1 Tax=Salinigranum rubrum TaxID=755307 RepID=A0A2I8VP57_9EURY|nr:hypothetical protein C2R22_20320 [Salinigranum rubrum]
MGGKKTEACGRCAMSSVVGLSQDGDGDEESRSRDPFGEARIEVDERQLRAVSPSAWLGGVKQWLDDTATRLTYGDR